MADRHGNMLPAGLGLNGGPSTQAIALTKKSPIHVKGLWKVHNAIVVTRR